MTSEGEVKTIQILELFGGIGSPRCALRNIGIPTKSIDYVEIDEKAVKSYNAMFADELQYKTQTVVGWNLRPDILVHGSPCQDFSIAGKQKGADEGSETRSSLMWETIKIIQKHGMKEFPVSGKVDGLIYFFGRKDAVLKQRKKQIPKVKQSLSKSKRSTKKHD